MIEPMTEPSAHRVALTDLSRELMQRTFQTQLPALPFSRDLFLLETHVAGLAHYQIASVQDLLVVGLPLLLQREPCNAHDDLAIEVLTQGRVKLGYVPKNRNPVLARLMDAGKLIVAEVASVGTWDGWGQDTVEVRLCISLRE
jgi:hypothetical protein